MQVHIDIRYKKDTGPNDRIRSLLSSSINRLMRGLSANIPIYSTNPRYGLLVAENGNTSYEEWFVPANFNPHVIFNELSLILIKTRQQYQGLYDNFHVTQNTDVVNSYGMSLVLLAMMSTWVYLPLFIFGFFTAVF